MNQTVAELEARIKRLHDSLKSPKFGLRDERDLIAKAIKRAERRLQKVQNKS